MIFNETYTVRLSLRAVFSACTPPDRDLPSANCTKLQGGRHREETQILQTPGTSVHRQRRE